MTDVPRPTRDDQLERYLDGLLDDAQRAAFDEALRTDAGRRREIELQSRIDSSLARLFRAEPPAQHRVTALLAAASGESKAKSAPIGLQKLWWSVAGLAAAAVLAWAVAGPLLQSKRRGTNFAARPLPDVYREAVANGFEPEYHCSEAERFADTFARRQGQPLKLLALPVGVRMMGLAYPGGLSRDTTAMLCRVDGKPVIVFVDRVDSDQPIANQHSDKSVHVFRTERDGLVYYEVTPLDAPRVYNFIVPQSAPGASELPTGAAA
jgi:anti-sigma-K factor RskA